jgi:hypothetical protein
MVVADLYSLPRINGKMSTEHKILQRKGMKVLPSYVDEINNQQSGKLFVIDQEATDLIHDAQAQKHAKQELQKTATSNGAMDFVNTLVNAVANNGQKEQPKKEVENGVIIPDGVPSEDWNKEKLIAYLTEKNIEFKASFGIGKLLDLAKEGGQNA